MKNEINLLKYDPTLKKTIRIKRSIFFDEDRASFYNWVLHFVTVLNLILKNASSSPS